MTNLEIQDSVLSKNEKTNSPLLPRDTKEVSIEIKNLGLKFYRNPNQAFTIKGIYRGFCDKVLHNYKVDGFEESEMYRWVWRHLNLKVYDGDILAIMGANGEGKSTLLRALAGLIQADEGSIYATHRPFLLSTGLGFREELSGLENIRMGGLFMGLSVREIKSKVPDIKEFAELSDEALAKPVKYYSDGMKARLIFSVATCTNRPILFLDEILGAGDIGFQKKAKARMDTLLGNAKTIVLVSHNKEFVLSAATRGILLQGGEITCDGKIEDVVAEYEKICG